MRYNVPINVLKKAAAKFIKSKDRYSYNAEVYNGVCIVCVCVCMCVCMSTIHMYMDMCMCVHMHTYV